MANSSSSSSSPAGFLCAPISSLLIKVSKIEALCQQLVYNKKACLSLYSDIELVKPLLMKITPQVESTREVQAILRRLSAVLTDAVGLFSEHTSSKKGKRARKRSTYSQEFIQTSRKIAKEYELLNTARRMIVQTQKARLSPYFEGDSSGCPGWIAQHNEFSKSNEKPPQMMKGYDSKIISKASHLRKQREKHLRKFSAPRVATQSTYLPKPQAVQSQPRPQSLPSNDFSKQQQKQPKQQEQQQHQQHQQVYYQQQPNHSQQQPVYYQPFLKITTADGKQQFIPVKFVQQQSNSSTQQQQQMYYPQQQN